MCSDMPGNGAVPIEVRRAWTGNDSRTSTAAATDVLRKEGFEAVTLQGLLHPKPAAFLRGEQMNIYAGANSRAQIEPSLK
jgi:hypothetical protein